MAEAFKHLIGPAVVKQVAHHLHRVSPTFKSKRFEQLALDGLEGLEFKARAQHLSQALQATLPERFEEAADLLQASLKAVPRPRFEHDPDDDLGTLSTDDTGLGGWALWAFGDFVAQRGMGHPERALLALHAITQRFTAEFAIRPFIVQHPELVFRTLQGWVGDPSAHVRRLVSEGSRPRLPWGLRLQALVKDPRPTLPLLHALQDDPSEYVRRSVANHLNDIAKDHPELISNWLAEHLPDAPLSRQRLLRHASRSLIKSGHPGVMQAWGLGQGLVGKARLSASPAKARIGEKVTLHIELTAASDHATDQRLEVDYLVHHIKANGSTSPKAFKGKRVILPSRGSVGWDKAHSFVPVSTRRYFPGEHRIELQVNGQVVAHTSVMLTEA
jgi:3-methyladenine DNA glycosylase AlkC